MARYHINPETGNPNICRAKTPESCRYSTEGTVAEHFDSKDEARAAYEKQMSGEKKDMPKSASRNRIGDRSGNTRSRDGIASVRIGDIIENTGVETQFGTCELCYSTGKTDLPEFLVEFLKEDGEVKESGWVEAYDWDYGDLIGLSPFINLVDFAEWINKNGSKIMMKTHGVAIEQGLRSFRFRQLSTLSEAYIRRPRT